MRLSQMESCQRPGQGGGNGTSQALQLWSRAWGLAGGRARNVVAANAEWPWTNNGGPIAGIARSNKVCAAA